MSNAGTSSTVRLTTAQAIVRYLIAQRTVIDDVEVPLFPGVYAIFGHGNVTSLGHALQEAGDALPTWRGQNEQGMALAAVGFAKAARRRQIMVATSSIGPGALNMVTAAGVAHANRLPVLLLAGDTFQSRVPDPVLQQVEHFGDPTITVNDAFRPVVRYWDRIARPDQLVRSLPEAVATMLDPANCGPAFLALPQDVQAEAFDFPERFFATTVHEIARPRPDTGQLRRAVEMLRTAERPLLIAGGGVHYSGAEAELTAFAERYGIPVVETVAGKACLLAAHPLNAGTGRRHRLSVGQRVGGRGRCRDRRRHPVAGLHHRLVDRVRRWTPASSGSTRRGSTPASTRRHRWSATPARRWPRCRHDSTGGRHRRRGRAAPPRRPWGTTPTSTRSPSPPTTCRPTPRSSAPSTERALPTDYALTAAGGFPGELNNGWRAKGLDSFDCEYGFSCMGYEISGAWGAKMARPDREVITFVGDGSYLMMNSDLYSSVLAGHKLIVIVCDNGGYAVIHRLQTNQGGVGFNNLIADTRNVGEVAVDFAAHARSMGCLAEDVTTIAELDAAVERARAADRTTVIALRTTQNDWTEGGGFWEVGVPEVSNRAEVRAAKAEMELGKRRQRLV